MKLQNALAAVGLFFLLITTPYATANYVYATIGSNSSVKGYSCSGTCGNPLNAYDENFDTYATRKLAGTGWWQLNFTVPYPTFAVDWDDSFLTIKNGAELGLSTVTRVYELNTTKALCQDSDFTVYASDIVTGTDPHIASLKCGGVVGQALQIFYSNNDVAYDKMYYLYDFSLTYNATNCTSNYLALDFSESTTFSIYKEDGNVTTHTDDRWVQCEADVSSPTVTVTFNEHNMQMLRFDLTDDENISYNLNVETYNPSANNPSFIVKDTEYNTIENARVEAKSSGTTVSEIGLTNADGELTLYVSDNVTYEFCASKSGYTQTTASCYVASPEEADEMENKVLYLTAVVAATPAPTFNITNGTIVANETTGDTYLNLTLAKGWLSTTRESKTGLFIIIVLAVIIAMIFESKIAGHGLTAAMMFLGFFVFFWKILLVPISIFILLKIFDMTKTLG